jgi:RNA polymerase sigma-70 factor (ECF subfamily)
VLQSGIPSPDPAAELRSVLLRAVRRACPRWLADRSEDLAQAAVVRVLEARREGTDPVPASYLYKVAYTTLIDEIRRLRRRPEVPLEAGPDEGASPAEPPGPRAADPEAALAGAEVGRAIGDCLARLAEPRRLAVTLHLQGHSVPEAAALLGWDGKRTENLVYRGMAELRRCLEGRGVTP